MKSIYYKQKDNKDIRDISFKHFFSLYEHIDSSKKGPCITHIINDVILVRKFILKSGEEIIIREIIYIIPENLEDIFIERYNELFGFIKIDLNDRIIGDFYFEPGFTNIEIDYNDWI